MSYLCRRIPHPRICLCASHIRFGNRHPKRGGRTDEEKVNRKQKNTNEEDYGVVG